MNSVLTLKHVFVLFMLGLLALPGIAQKKLQIDRYGKKKAMYYHIGDRMHFKLKGDDVYYSLILKNMDADKQTLIFDTGEIHVDEIVEIKRFQKAANAFAYSFMTFGTVWTGFTVIGAVAGGPPVTLATGLIGGGFVVVGGLIKLLFSKRKFRFDKKRKMRVLDLNINRPTGNQDWLAVPRA
ncbi:MAG: hypothetical protein AAFV80_23810 [Bacteroidota bacterium]